MRVTVTGGAGYVGSISVRHLLDAGWDVTVLDDLSRGNAPAVDPRARLVVGDIGDHAALEEALGGTDAVLHCAGFILVDESEREPELYERTNHLKPVSMLDAMERLGVTGIVFSSTAAVYGEPVRVPIREGDPCRPVNVYGRSKLALEREMESRAARGLRAIRFRYFNVAGAWPDSSLGEDHHPETHIIPRLLRAAMSDAPSFGLYGTDYDTSDGTCVRDYVHVTDLAAAHALALERLVSGGGSGVFNLGSRTGTTNRQVIDACQRVTGARFAIEERPRRAGDPARLVADPSAAQAELGWAPGRGAIETMVADAWRWHTAHPQGYALR